MINKAIMRSVMVRHSDTQEKLAEALNLQISGLNARINGKVDFRAREIAKIRDRYNLTSDEVMEIFFDGIAS